MAPSGAVRSNSSTAQPLPPDLPRLLDFLRDLLPELRQQHGVATLAVFGSRTRADATPESDLDLLVTFERPIGLLELVGLEQELSRRFGCNVDLVTPRSLKPRLAAPILSSAVGV